MRAPPPPGVRSAAIIFGDLGGPALQRRGDKFEPTSCFYSVLVTQNASSFLFYRLKTSRWRGLRAHGMSWSRKKRREATPHAKPRHYSLVLDERRLPLTSTQTPPSNHERDVHHQEGRPEGVGPLRQDHQPHLQALLRPQPQGA